jgi:hypothetical protein
VMRKVLTDYRVALDTAAIVAGLVGIRALLFAVGVDGMSLSPLASSIVAGGVFVMGLVVAGTLSDYKDADRAPSDLATELYAILRECESMHAVWGTPDMATLRRRLIAVVTGLRADIDAGDTRECQQAIEDLSESFLELDRSDDVPANYIVRLRQSQSTLRKAILRVYHIQREEFLPSAYAMIVSLVVIILGVVVVTDFNGVGQSLVTVGFLAFFFIYLLRLLRVIDKPFKVGRERTDDVSLFLLTEFVVHAHAGDEGVAAEDVAAQAEEVEELLTDVEEQADELTDAAELAEAAELADADDPPDAAARPS